MEKEFVPYAESLELKALGFDEDCFGFYERNKELVIQKCEVTDFHFGSLECLAPTFSQSFKFFREKYGLDNAILKDRFVIETEEDLPNWYYGFKSYEEAELACLRKLIEIVKSNKS